MLNDRENILRALREKPLKAYEVMKRANVINEEACLPAVENARRRLGEIRHPQRAMAPRMIREIAATFSVDHRRLVGALRSIVGGTAGIIQNLDKGRED